MMLQRSSMMLLLSCAASSAFVFQSQSQQSQQQQRISRSTSASSSKLFISSWGIQGSPTSRVAYDDRDPEAHVQDYLEEPEAVEPRFGLDGTILVSGACNREGQTDQFIFDLLNHEASAFKFETITAFVDDAAKAKKRLLSRSARYTGLLDKLDFKQAETPGAFPTVDQLKNVTTWLAIVEKDSEGKVDLLQQCHVIADLVNDAKDLENISILLTGATNLEKEACESALKRFTDLAHELTFSIVAVGTLNDKPEGAEFYYHRKFEEEMLPEEATFSRQEAYRMVTELLQLECGADKALSFAEVSTNNVTEARLISGLRAAGYLRVQEVDHMIRVGPEAYDKAIEEWHKTNPDARKGYTTNAWWEAPEFQKSRERSDAREKAKAKVVLDERTVEIEKIATEWAKRAYYEASLDGATDLTEDDYIKSVWNRALKEGDLAYRQTQGELTEEEAKTELLDFKTRQERKEKVMLGRAKKELSDLLDEPNLFKDDDKDDDDDKKD